MRFLTRSRRYWCGSSKSAQLITYRVQRWMSLVNSSQVTLFHVLVTSIARKDHAVRFLCELCQKSCLSRWIRNVIAHKSQHPPCYRRDTARDVRKSHRTLHLYDRLLKKSNVQLLNKNVDTHIVVRSFSDVGLLFINTGSQKLY